MDILKLQFDNLWKNYWTRVFSRQRDKGVGKKMLYFVGFNIYAFDIIILGWGINAFYASLAIMNLVFRLRWAYPKTEGPSIQKAIRRWPKPLFPGKKR